MRQLTFLVFLLILTSIGCKQNVETTPEQTSTSSEPLPTPSWVESAVLYEVNTRNFTAEGTFKAFESHLPRLRSMGVDILWFMPIHPISMKNRKAENEVLVEDIEDPEERKKYVGSPYAVANYKEVNPELGTMDDFKEMVTSAHQKGMKVIIDWVPNHTGWDNEWITEHPEWYTKDADGNIIDPINPSTGEPWGWTDVADLDYDNQEMRKEMIDIMKFWITDVGIDGFRVDVAHGIPNDFWDQMREAFLSLPKEVFMLAEAEIPYHRNSGAFHASYGWSFHHLLNEIAHGEKNAKDVKKWYKEDQEKFDRGFHIHFTSNHDENTWAGTVFERMGDAHKAMAVLAATMPGMPLLYNGQEIPLDFRIPFFVRDTLEWNDLQYEDFYKTLFEIKDQSTVLRNTKGADMEFLSNNENVLAFRRKNNYDDIIVIINLTDQDQTYAINANVEKCREIFTSSLVDVVAEESREIGPWEYQVLDGSYGR